MTEPNFLNQALPDLKLQTIDGETVSITAVLNQQLTLLSVLHGTWCPECVSQFRSLQQHRSEIAAAGAKIVVVTQDTLGPLMAFLISSRPPLEYVVLADPDNSAHQAIGAGQDTLDIIVDRHGIVRWTKQWKDHRDHPGYQSMVQILREIEKHTRLAAS